MLTNGISSRKWSHVNKREMELIFQMFIQVGEKEFKANNSNPSGPLRH